MNQGNNNMGYNNNNNMGYNNQQPDNQSLYGTGSQHGGFNQNDMNNMNNNYNMNNMNNMDNNNYNNNNNMGYDNNNMNNNMNNMNNNNYNMGYQQNNNDNNNNMNNNMNNMGYQQNNDNNNMNNNDNMNNNNIDQKPNINASSGGVQFQAKSNSKYWDDDSQQGFMQEMQGRIQQIIGYNDWGNGVGQMVDQINEASQSVLKASKKPNYKYISHTLIIPVNGGYQMGQKIHWQTKTDVCINVRVTSNTLEVILEAYCVAM